MTGKTKINISGINSRKDLRLINVYDFNTRVNAITRNLMSLVVLQAAVTGFEAAIFEGCLMNTRVRLEALMQRMLNTFFV